MTPLSRAPQGRRSRTPTTELSPSWRRIAMMALLALALVVIIGAMLFVLRG